MAQADFTRIATNIGALNALASLRTINSKLGVHQQRLSTGKRINSAADDPAGLTIATKMLARSEGLKVALDNIGDAKNMLSVAEAGLGKITDILVTMRSKAEQAASDTLGASERAAIQAQLESYAEQIDNVVAETKWNGVKLLDGTIDKRFQTGADEGEYTRWQLSQKHDSATLNVSTNYTSAGVSNAVVIGDSFSGVTNSAVFAGLREISTGSYSFRVVDKSTAADQGKVNNVDYEAGFDGATLQLTSGAATAAELSSAAQWSVQITAVDTTDGAETISYIVTDGTTTITTNNVDISDLDGSGNPTGVLDLTNGGTKIGVSLNITNLANLAAAVTGGSDTATFEYIKSGEAKIQMLDASGQAVQIDKDGVDTSVDTATFAYRAAGAYDTGVGVTVTVGAWANLATNEPVTFDYHRAGSNVVDVSTAIKAASYMTTVNNALDIVNSSMADLGSLMARLTFKEDAVAVAQVNVEASYNRIMNADMAFEQLEATKFSILQQTAITMLAQANTAPQAILGLFR